MRKTQRRDVGALIVERGPRILYMWATLVFAVGIYRGETSVSRYISLKDSEVILSKAVEEIARENQRLGLEIFKLKQSKDYARKVLRDKYHATEADEKIMYFAD
ncbi:MAG: septum formation initiator family protein [Proteobacteria bacterium]|nr:septum formation initiator family protein [Pseudomonadota bacterium]